MSNDLTTVYLELEYIRTDPVAYKPYSPSLKPIKNSPIYIAIDVPTDLVDNLPEDYTKNKPTDGITLTTAGLADMMGQVAMAIKLRLEGGN